MNQLFYVRDYLRENVLFLNEYNCDIDSLTVFEYTAINADNEPVCVVISHTFSDRAYQPANVGNVLFDWKVLVNVFRILHGSRDDNAAQIQDAYLRARDIINSISDNPTLNGLVLDCALDSVLTPATYSRNDRDEYMMIGIVFAVKESV